MVLGILGLLLGLAFSGRSLVDNRRLAGAARDLGTDVRLVEQRARAERRCWRVQFDPSADTYAIQVLAGGTWTASLGCSGGTWTTWRVETLATRIDLLSTSFSGNIMEVSPYGTPNTGNAILRSAAGEQRKVTINAGGMVVITP